MDDKLLFLMSRSQHVLKEYLKAEFREKGINLTPARTGILFALEKQKDLSMNALAKILFIDNALITRHIDFLEKEGLVKRTSDNRDRRKYIIEITETGLAAASEAKKTVSRVNNLIKEGFSDREIEIFKNILNSFFIKFSINGG